MSHPVTLFTGQWADLPFEEVARLADSWGYDGLEIAASDARLAGPFIGSKIWFAKDRQGLALGVFGQRP